MENRVFELAIAILIWENVDPCFGQNYTSS